MNLNTLLPLLATLACPIGMGLLMWLMNKNMNSQGEQVKRADGPVIECGSGLTTILLGTELQKRHQKLYSLEHHPIWATRIRREIQAANLSSVEICEHPLRSFGNYSWYDVPLSRLPGNRGLVKLRHQ